MVLLADGRGDAGVRAVGVRERGVPRACHGRAGAEDVQAPRQRHRADGAAGRARGGRGALVFRRVRVAVGAAADRARRARRDRAEGAAHLLEHGVLPGALRERQAAAAGSGAGRWCWLPVRRGRRRTPRSRPTLARGRCLTGGCCRRCTRACGT